MNCEETSAPVPARDKQVEEDLWQRHKAERGVWTEPMLMALERGMEGNKWFSLIDSGAKRDSRPDFPSKRLPATFGRNGHLGWHGKR
jgi:hypothetical protein